MLYRVVRTIHALLKVRSEMLPFSGNIQNIKMFGVPPNTLPWVMYIMIICHWAYCITVWHSKQLQEGLMVVSDDFLHFLKIKKKKKFRIHQNYLVALKKPKTNKEQTKTTFKCNPCLYCLSISISYPAWSRQLFWIHDQTWWN